MPHTPEILRYALVGLEQERQAIDLRIAELRAQISGQDGAPAQTTQAEPKKKPRRKLSAAARKRIAAAQRARWAAYREKNA